MHAMVEPTFLTAKTAARAIVHVCDHRLDSMSGRRRYQDGYVLLIV